MLYYKSRGTPAAAWPHGTRACWPSGRSWRLGYS